MRMRQVAGVLFLSLIAVRGYSAGLPAPVRPDLYVVAIGEEATHDAEDLATTFTRLFGVTVKTLPFKPLPARCYTAARSQYNSRCLLGLLDVTFPGVTDKGKGALIAVTRTDIYIPEVPWAFA